MISLKLIAFACVLFLIDIKATPKPDPYWNWNGFPGSNANPGQLNLNGFPGLDANPGLFNWNGFPPSGDANPGPWNWNGFPPSRDANPRTLNWNGFPPSRGANPWQLYWNGSPNLNRGANLWQSNWNGSPNINRGGVIKNGEKYIRCEIRHKRRRKSAPDGMKGCLRPGPFWSLKYGKCKHQCEYDDGDFCTPDEDYCECTTKCEACGPREDCSFVDDGSWPHFKIYKQKNRGL